MDFGSRTKRAVTMEIMSTVTAVIPLVTKKLFGHVSILTILLVFARSTLLLLVEMA